MLSFDRGLIIAAHSFALEDDGETVIVLTQTNGIL
jgi:hypothetical protein